MKVYFLISLILTSAFSLPESGKPSGEDSEGTGWRTYACGALAGVGAVGVGVTALGFAPAGIAAGSVAAAWQAYIGNVAAGSALATLQSAGAAGTFSWLSGGGLGGCAALLTPDVYGWISGSEGSEEPEKAEQKATTESKSSEEPEKPEEKATGGSKSSEEPEKAEQKATAESKFKDDHFQENLQDIPKKSFGKTAGWYVGATLGWPMGNVLPMGSCEISSKVIICNS